MTKWKMDTHLGHWVQDMKNKGVGNSEMIIALNRMCKSVQGPKIKSRDLINISDGNCLSLWSFDVIICHHTTFNDI